MSTRDLGPPVRMEVVRLLVEVEGEQTGHGQVALVEEVDRLADDVAAGGCRPPALGKLVRPAIELA